MNKHNLNILVSGVGGQGTVLAGKLLSACALDKGASVRSAETIGMAQRGGSVLGHVRLSRSDATHTLSSPLIPKGEAQLLIGFEPGETLKSYVYCARDALVVTATKPLSPPTASLHKLNYDGKAQLSALETEAAEGRIATLLLIDNEVVLHELGSDRALNVVLLGAALNMLEANDSYQWTALSYPAMQETIQATVKKQFIELNLRALEIGYQQQCT